MDHPSLSLSQIKKLGDRLRESERPSEDDLQLLQRFRARHDGTLADVGAALVDIGLEPTTRLKTVDTIIQKLRGTTTKLDQMQDVAGTRMVHDCTLAEQDDLATKVITRFSQYRYRIVDRRFSDPDGSTLKLDNVRAAGPSHGYRAVHIILTVDGLSIEVQLRTRWQDVWAQVVERVADQWGRSIRYGGQPESPDAQVHGGWTRGSFVEMFGNLSQQIATIEGWPSQIEESQETLELRKALKSQSKRGGKGYAAAIHQDRLLRLSFAEMAELRREKDKFKRQFAEFLSQLAEIPL